MCIFMQLVIILTHITCGWHSFRKPLSSQGYKVHTFGICFPYWGYRQVVLVVRLEVKLIMVRTDQSWSLQKRKLGQLPASLPAWLIGIFGWPDLRPAQQGTNKTGSISLLHSALTAWPIRYLHWKCYFTQWPELGPSGFLGWLPHPTGFA